ncbi:transcriptional regulator, TetR family domain protein [Burkholderia mallei]|nr:transcriptional regulator, TetR family domain protein [Burkholderia mallei]
MCATQHRRVCPDDEIRRTRKVAVYNRPTAFKTATRAGLRFTQQYWQRPPVRQTQGRTTWKRNLPAARANGYLSCR